MNDVRPLSVLSIAWIAALAPATIAAAHCEITYRLTSDVTLASLLMTSGYAAADGEFVGEFGGVQCTDLSGGQPIFNDNENAELLGLSFFAPSGFEGPTDLAVCEFEPNGANPAPADFVSNIQLAGDTQGQPVSGVEVIVSRVSCEGAGSTTTSTTLPAAGSCADPGGNGVTASDALFVLGAAVGSRTCDECVCDVDGSGSVTASDALLTLRAAVGSAVTLNCPPCS